VTWNELSPIYRVVVLTFVLLAAIGTIVLAIGALWLLARRSLWANVSL